jgi:hypothetical protein
MRKTPFKYKCRIESKRVSDKEWYWCVLYGYKLLATRHSFDLAFKSMVTWQKVMAYAPN